MKKLLALALALLLVFPAVCASAETFSDKDSGVTVSMPDGWTKDTSNTEEMLKFQILAPTSTGSNPSMIQFLTMDLFTYAGGSVSRELLNENILSEELIKTALANYTILGIEERQINGHKFMIYDFSVNISNITAKAKGAVTLKNGYLIMFQFLSVNDFSTYLPTFEAMLTTVTIK